MVDEWLGDLRAVRHLKRSTLRAYQEAVRSFCHYITDPAYGWPSVCEQRFGTHPIQVVHEWNTAVHVQDAEADPGKRALTLAELEALFDHADVQVARVRAAGRKGWLPAFRDAALFKIAYGYGLRRNDVRMLDTVNFGRNPHGPEYGDYGLVYVRHGKAKKGSAPKRRSVLTVWDWTPWIIEQWITEVRSTPPRERPYTTTPNRPRVGCPSEGELVVLLVGGDEEFPRLYRWFAVLCPPVVGGFGFIPQAAWSVLSHGVGAGVRAVCGGGP